MTVDLSTLQHCFQGVMPAIVATCSKDGEPNITYVSQVYWVDAKHVALSRQFFNKTVKNIEENPYASIQLYDPVTFEAYALDIRFLRSETSGPMFDTMFVRIEAIASHTGMKGVFRLIAADVYEVLSVRKVEGYLDPSAGNGPRPFSGPAERPFELRALQAVSDRLNRANDLDELLTSLLATLRDELGFEHSMLLLPDETGKKLFTVASIGYGESGVGAEIEVGRGLVGTVAQQKKILRVSEVDRDLRYGRAIREEAIREEATSGRHTAAAAEIPLPGLADAHSHLGIPLLVQDRLVGVLAVESKSALSFDEWHEAFLAIVANQAAIAVDRMIQREDAEPPAPSVAVPSIATTRHVFKLYKGEDCVFVDGEYLIRNVPAKILWKVLKAWVESERVDFTNRELRLDPWLGLPPVKDNLESRLILLRKRLEQKCPDVRIPSCSRGHFRLELDCIVALEEQG